MAENNASRNWGGARKGSGQKPTGRTLHRYYVTSEESEKIKKFIERIRKEDEVKVKDK